MTAMGIRCTLEESILETNACLSSFNSNISHVAEGMSHPILFQDISKPARWTSVVRDGALAGFQLPSLAQLQGNHGARKLADENKERHCPHDFGCLDLYVVCGRYSDQMVSIKRYRQPHLGTRPMKPGGIQKCTMWAYSNSRGSNIHTTLMHAKVARGSRQPLGHFGPRKWRP